MDNAALQVDFKSVPRITTAPGASTGIGPFLAEAFGCRRVLVVTDRGVHGLGLTGDAMAGLAQAGVEAAVFDGTRADPPEAVVLEAVGQAREMGADGVIGLGGGSSLDVAKLVALLVRSPQPLDRIYGVGLAQGPRLPLVQAPTTAGTGSEVTPIAIVTTGTAEKKGVVASQLMADAAFLDPDLTLGLPPKVTAAVGIDAMVHAIEAYTSARLKNPISDGLARQALALLWPNIRQAVADGTDRAARGAMLLGSMLAGMAFCNAPVAAVHALAYPIGGQFHVPHGLSNSLVLPHVLRFNMAGPDGQKARALYDQLSDILAPGRGADGVVAALAALAPDLGIETRLGEVGISHNHLPKLAEDAIAQQRLLVNNPRPVSQADALAIYQAAL